MKRAVTAVDFEVPAGACDCHTHIHGDTAQFPYFSELGIQQPGFAELLEQVRSGKVYVKISGAYRASKLAPDYPDAAPLARSLIAANPERIVWGTDWPHPDTVGGSTAHVTPLLQVDDGRLLNQLPAWAPDAATRRKILVDNPARLYRF